TQKQDEVTGDRERRVAVEVLFDERQREIHSSAHASRRPDLAVADEDRIRIDVHARMHARELLGRRPMGGRTTALEQAGAGKKECARANRGGAPDHAGGAGYPAGESGVCGGPRTAGPPGDDHRVDVRGRIGEAAVGRNGQPTRGAKLDAVLAEHRYPIPTRLASAALDEPGGSGEDLER